MLYLTYKKANHLFLKKETVIALKMSIGNILPKGKFIILCLSITNFYFFFGIGSYQYDVNFSQNVQCYKILHPENETGFHNL